MVRSIFLALVLVFSFGCTAAVTSSDVRSGLGAKIATSHSRKTIVGGFVAEDGISRIDFTDIVSNNSYREIGPRFTHEQNGLSKVFTLVADNKRHYFCEVDTFTRIDPFTHEHQLKTIVQTNGCAIVRPARPDEISSK